MASHVVVPVTQKGFVIRDRKLLSRYVPSPAPDLDRVCDRRQQTTVASLIVVILTMVILPTQVRFVIGDSKQLWLLSLWWFF